MGWVNPGEMKTKPPAIVGSARCMPGAPSWEIARKFYWEEMKERE